MFSDRSWRCRILPAHSVRLCIAPCTIVHACDSVFFKWHVALRNNDIPKPELIMWFESQVSPFFSQKAPKNPTNPQKPTSTKKPKNAKNCSLFDSGRPRKIAFSAGRRAVFPDISSDVPSNYPFQRNSDTESEIFSQDFENFDSTWQLSNSI